MKNRKNTRVAESLDVAAKNLESYPDVASDKAWQYIDDFRLHVFEMRYLPPEVRQRFTSDMRIIVEYLADRKSIKTLKHPIKHLDAVLRMLQALSHDDRYLDVLEMVEKDKKADEGGEHNMCEVLDEYWNGGVAQGRSEGRLEGRSEGRTEGKSEAIIEILEELGVLPAGLRSRISEEKNLDVLSRWVKWAARAGSISEFEARLAN